MDIKTVMDFRILLIVRLTKEAECSCCCRNVKVVKKWEEKDRRTKYTLQGMYTTGYDNLF